MDMLQHQLHAHFENISIILYYLFLGFSIGDQKKWEANDQNTNVLLS